MPWFYILQKQKACYLLLGKNISFTRFTLILVLKTVILNKFMSKLVLLLMMNLAGDHSLLAHVKQFEKIFICCHSSDTLWTLLSASCLVMLVFALITGTCKTVWKNLYLLSQLRHFVDTPKRKLFGHACISPHLTYTSTVWDCCSDTLLNRLNSLHRKAAKFISDSTLTTDTKLRYLGLLPLKEKLMFNKAVLVFKAYINLAPPYLKQLFSCSNTHATSRFITLPKPKIYLFKTSFSFSGASLWNTIPTQIKSCNSLISFKTQLHKWFRSSLL